LFTRSGNNTDPSGQHPTMNAGTALLPSDAVQLTDLERQLQRVEGTLGVPFREAVATALLPVMSTRHGDLAHWRGVVESVFAPTAARVELDRPAPWVDLKEPVAVLLAALEALTPWRKGPFQLGAVDVQAEWDSARKWDRFVKRVPLAGKRVLDVGAGNGYFTLRAVGAGAAFALGIDPSWHYNAQWALLQRLFQCQQAALLPLRLKDLPTLEPAFDVVFSMGVLYHQRDPLTHLAELRRALEPGGQLVLESLVLQVPESTCLVPRERYAAMRNVWFIPSPACVESWLLRSGFETCECIDISRTTAAEQRPSPWMRAPSLQDFLDPTDSTRTIEGYPAPVRAVFLAR
jgi:tRNA (mo5U34)-methyltransferase